MITVEAAICEIGASDDGFCLFAGSEQIQLGMEDAVVRFGDKSIFVAN